MPWIIEWPILFPKQYISLTNRSNQTAAPVLYTMLLFLFCPYFIIIISYCWCSVAELCPTLCYPLDCSRPGSSVLQYLLEFPQTHVHWISDAIQPSHPLLPPSPPALNLSQHQSFPMSWLFELGDQSIGTSASAAVLSMNIQDWFLPGLTGSISLLPKGL